MNENLYVNSRLDSATPRIQQITSFEVTGILLPTDSDETSLKNLCSTEIYTLTVGSLAVWETTKRSGALLFISGMPNPGLSRKHNVLKRRIPEVTT